MLQEIDRTAAEVGVTRTDLIRARLMKAAVEDRLSRDERASLE